MYGLPKNVCVVPVIPSEASRCSFYMFCFVFLYVGKLSPHLGV